MVRDLHFEEVPNNSPTNAVKNENSKSSLIWDTTKKRPNKFLLIIIISVTVLLFVGYYVNIYIYHHEIRVICEYEGGFSCDVIFEGSIYGGGGSNKEVYVYRIREGVRIDVQASRSISSFSGPLTVSIYDNGNLVISNTTTEQYYPINLIYIVGE